MASGLINRMVKEQRYFEQDNWTLRGQQETTTEARKQTLSVLCDFLVKDVVCLITDYAFRKFCFPAFSLSLALL
jgi:hypothetical protein